VLSAFRALPAPDKKLIWIAAANQAALAQKVSRRRRRHRPAASLLPIEKLMAPATW
jgi:hypothetical protein